MYVRLWGIELTVYSSYFKEALDLNATFKICYILKAIFELLE